MRQSMGREQLHDNGRISLRDIFAVAGLAFIGAYGLHAIDNAKQDERENVPTTVSSVSDIGSIPLDATIQTSVVTISPEDQAILEAIDAHHSGTDSTIEGVLPSTATTLSEVPLDPSHADHPAETVPVLTAIVQADMPAHAPQETTHDHGTQVPAANAPVTVTTHAHEAPAITTPNTAPITATTVQVTHEMVPVTASGTVPVPAG